MNQDDTTAGDFPLSCVHCGMAIDHFDWHPVTAIRENGKMQVLHFCSKFCREEWDGE